MNLQVETILQAALLDRKEVQLSNKLVSAHALIENAINNLILPLQENIVDEKILVPRQKISATIFLCGDSNIPLFKDTFE